LWTTKYAPTNLKEICGNKTNVERLGTWLSEWDKNYKSGFKKPGKDGMGIYRAVLISGPPGIGKTTSAHLMAKEAGYNPIELNASDSRSKKLVEVSQLEWVPTKLMSRIRQISTMPHWTDSLVGAVYK
jgi:replication factor C subunit 1